MLACILTLPPHQRKGYGKLIISSSYELSKLENKVGSPEKPLSDLGKLSYRSYWTCRILQFLNDFCVKSDSSTPSLENIGKATAKIREDIISTLQSLRLLRFLRGQYVIAISEKTIKEQLQPFLDRGYTKHFCHAKYVTWELQQISLPPPSQIETSTT